MMIRVISDSTLLVEVQGFLVWGSVAGVLGLREEPVATQAQRGTDVGTPAQMMDWNNWKTN
jgi:hypothetical protein